MFRRRIEKLEAHFPLSLGRLLERLDRQPLNSPSGNDRHLVTQMLQASGRRKTWPTEYRAAEDRYLENFGLSHQEISDADLAGLITHLERQLGHPIPNMEAIARDTAVFFSGG